MPSNHDTPVRACRKIGTPTFRLPNTCPQNKYGESHVTLITRVTPDRSAYGGVGFVGDIYRAGAAITLEQMGANPVALEAAGPQGLYHRRGNPRERLWILWRWDGGEWREIARALAYDCSWSLALTEPAIRALCPRSRDMDAIERSREVTEGLLIHIDTALVIELPAVRLAVLTSLYDACAGRIVAA